VILSVLDEITRLGAGETGEVGRGNRGQVVLRSGSDPQQFLREEPAVDQEAIDAW
jgi:hypothetical protein